MFSTLSRAYKEQTPDETIERIRGILDRMELFPEEIYSANPYPGIYSSSISLPPDEGGFRTNGKGRTQAYSLASAYAEYMERMQNLLFATFSRSLAIRLRDEFGFFYTPDEDYIDRRSFEALPDEMVADFLRYSGRDRDEFISAYFDRVTRNGMPGVAALPFYDTGNRRVQLLPLNLLLVTVGSNGMASGNSLPEAIFQALCELMERWSAALVYYNQLTPPTVPSEYLSRFTDEWSIIQSIEEGGHYHVVVKDFSAGRGIPSVGVMISNADRSRYRLNVGCETCFQVALSRSLTEIFQGIQDTEQFDAAMIPVPESVPDYFVEEDDEARNIRFQNFTQFTRDNSGVFPPALFQDSPSYPFDAGSFEALGSYDEEVRHLVRFFHASGLNVFMRDVSFLGFPSVFVYVPEVSAQGRKSAPVLSGRGRYQVIDLDSIEHDFFDLGGCSRDQQAAIVERLGSFEPAAPVAQLFNVELAPDCPEKQLNVAFLLTQLCYSMGRYGEALEHFRRFCDTRAEPGPYYTLVGHYLQGKADGVQSSRLRESLTPVAESLEVPQSVADQVVDDLAEPYSVVAYSSLPRCPDCGECALRESCETRHKLTLARKVYSNMEVICQAGSLGWVH